MLYCVSSGNDRKIVIARDELIVKVKMFKYLIKSRKKQKKHYFE